MPSETEFIGKILYFQNIRHVFRYLGNDVNPGVYAEVAKYHLWVFLQKKAEKARFIPLQRVFKKKKRIFQVYTAVHKEGRDNVNFYDNN